MNPEYLMIAAMTIPTLLFPLGGTGFKWARRDLCPALLAVCAFLYGIAWWKCLIFAVLLDIAFRLPYGERTPWALKFLVGCSYPAATLITGFSPYQIVYPFIFIAIFAASNYKKTSNIFVWKICEAMMGFGIGVIMAHILSV